MSADRRYVAAYVEYVHYVERLYDRAGNPLMATIPEPTAAVHAD